MTAVQEVAGDPISALSSTRGGLRPPGGQGSRDPDASGCGPAGRDRLGPGVRGSLAPFSTHVWAGRGSARGKTPRRTPKGYRSRIVCDNPHKEP